MGIPRGVARLLLDEYRRRRFGGALLQLGRSTVYFNLPTLQRWAALHGVALTPVESPRLSHDHCLAQQGCIDDRTLFRALGFETVESCDISDWEGADHRLDLNQPIPPAMHGRYDVVLDLGTSVQVFHLPNVLRGIFDLLPVGGRVIHAAVPSNNHIDLGFVMPSPTFFYDYYRANGFTIESFYLCEYVPYWHLGCFCSAPWRIYDYEPGSLDHLSHGIYGGAQAGIFLVATKTPASRGDVMPNLSFYERAWQAFATRQDDGVSAGELPQEGLAARFESLQLEHPLLANLYRPLKRFKERILRRLLLPRRMPRLVARY